MGIPLLDKMNILHQRAQEGQLQLDRQRAETSAWQKAADLVDPPQPSQNTPGLDAANTTGSPSELRNPETLGDDSTSNVPGLDDAMPASYVGGPVGGGASQQPSGASPASGATAAPQASGPSTPQDRVGYSIYKNPDSVFGNPQKLDALASIFMRSGNPQLAQQGTAWLEAGYKAHKENLLHSLQYAVGGDLPAAERAYNMTGDHTVQPGSLHWADDQKTTLAGKDADGNDFQINPKEMLKSFMSPSDFFSYQAKQQQLATETARQQSEGEKNAAIADYYRTAKKAADYGRAQYYANGGRGGKDFDKRTMDTIIQKGGLALRKQIESEQPKDDAKFNVNGMVSLVPSMQSDLGQSIRNGTDPEVAFQQTYNNYKDKVSGLNDALTQIVADAEKGNYRQATKDQALSSGVETLVRQYNTAPDEIMKFLPATSVPKNDQLRIRAALQKININTAPVSATPAKGAPQPATQTSQKVETPKTQADFDKLAKGARYVNPADGKTYIKK